MIHLGHPKLADEAGRLAAVRRYGVLDSMADREFDDVVALAKAMLAVPAAAITLVDADRLWYMSAVGLDTSAVPRALAFCDHTIRSTGPLAVEDLRGDARFAANPLVLGPARLRSYLGVPLATPEGYNVGSLCVMGTAPRSFEAGHKDVLRRLGRLVVSHMELRHAARHDALTSALGRSAFEEALRLAAAQAKALDAPAALLMIDIDHFKAVNDRWGHPAGDAVIQSVANVAHGMIRRRDRLGRLGGEEFGALLRDASPEEAVTTAERLRLAVAGLGLPALAGGSVTVSCGVADWQPGRPEVKDWMVAADAALYRAKRTGRDRVVRAA